MARGRDRVLVDDGKLPLSYSLVEFGMFACRRGLSGEALWLKLAVPASVPTPPPPDRGRFFSVVAPTRSGLLLLDDAPGAHHMHVFHAASRWPRVVGVHMALGTSSLWATLNHGPWPAEIRSHTN